MSVGIKDRLLVLVSFPGSGEGCSRLCVGLDCGGMVAPLDGGRPVTLGIDCFDGIGGLGGGTTLFLSSLEETLSGWRIGCCTGCAVG